MNGAEIEIKLSAEELEIINHATGGKKNYRNHYCIYPDSKKFPVIESLTRRGIMAHSGFANTAGMLTYHVTRMGIEFLNKIREASK